MKTAMFLLIERLSFSDPIEARKLRNAGAVCSDDFEREYQDFLGRPA
jgi:hypothetical protein